MRRGGLEAALRAGSGERARKRAVFDTVPAEAHLANLRRGVLDVAENGVAQVCF